MELLTYWLFRGLMAIIGAMSLGAGIRLGRALGLLGYYVLPGYRWLAMRNLGIAMPEKSPLERRLIVRRHFATLGGNLFAAERLARMPYDEIVPLLDVAGIDHIRELSARKRGFVLVISHIGNWELLAQITPGLFQVPTGTVFQRQGNRRIDAHFRASRARLGVELFERKEGFHKAAGVLAAGGCVGVLIDQHAGDSGVWCPFFGRLASTSPLAATLALRSGAALVPAAVHTDGIGRWRLVIDPAVEPVSSDSGEVTAQLHSVLERQILRQPEDWFWVHNRWKTPHPNFLLAKYKRGVAEVPRAASGGVPDANSGELFAYAASRLAAAPPRKPFRILIRSSNWLGDAVMTVPAVRAIKHGRPDAHVTILTPAKLADVWKLVPEVDVVISFPAPTGTGLMRRLRGELQVFKVAALLRPHGFDVAVLFPNSIRTALEVWLARIPRRVGYAGHVPRSVLLNQIYREWKGTVVAGPAAHQVRHYLKLAEYMGARIDEAQGYGFPFPSVPDGTPIRIAVCPGAEYGPAKRWLPERFAEVIQGVGASFECQWHLVGTEKDRPVAEEVARLAGSPPNLENLCGRTTLAELIDLLRKCHLLVTNDTGTMHLATLLGLRTVAIFGSTEPTMTGPLGPGHVVLRRQVECSPCFLRECPIDFRCMKAVESADAIDAVRKLLGGTAPQPADQAPAQSGVRK